MFVLVGVRIDVLVVDGVEVFVESADFVTVRCGDTVRVGVFVGCRGMGVATLTGIAVEVDISSVGANWDALVHAPKNQQEIIKKRIIFGFFMVRLDSVE